MSLSISVGVFPASLPYINNLLHMPGWSMFLVEILYIPLAQNIQPDRC